MVRKLSLVLALVLLALLSAQGVFAEIKHKFGFTELIRYEYWKNMRDMNNDLHDAGDRNFFRFKTSVWAKADYEDLYSLFARLSNEWKPYFYYGATAKKTVAGDSDEIYFDNLFLDVKDPGGLPVNLRLGRQDLIGMYGENFLIADGTPGDGPRSVYFNAVKASWKINSENTLDAIYLRQQKNDNFLPVIDTVKPEQVLASSEESAYVLYLKNKSIENLALEPYYIYKHEGAASGLQAQTGKIHTVGMFSKYAQAPWTLHLQLADQFGDYGPYDREGLGGYAFADYAAKEMAFSPVFTLGMIYLSGDDKNTTDNEGWDPLFSRFPQWSDLYAQEFTGESGAAYWTNLQLYRAQAALKLSGKSKLTLMYSLLRANELVPANASYSFSGNSKDRGDLYQAKLDYIFNKNFAGLILGEYFVPGKFYVDDADPAVYFRMQLEMKF